MGNLWDKPSPGPSDYTQEPVYEAVGRACTAWETLETTFGALYTALERIPYEEANIARYGRLARSNVARLHHLELAAERFFVRTCSQDEEGEFASIISTARRMIVRRNQLVHGVMMGWHVVTGFDEKKEPVRAISWCITSPMHCEEPLQQGEGRYYFGSHAILEFSERFFQLANRVGKLRDRLASASP